MSLRPKAVVLTPMISWESVLAVRHSEHFTLTTLVWPRLTYLIIAIITLHTSIASNTSHFDVSEKIVLTNETVVTRSAL